MLFVQHKLRIMPTHPPTQPLIHQSTWNTVKGVAELVTPTSFVTAPTPVSGQMRGSVATRRLLALNKVQLKIESGPPSGNFKVYLSFRDEPCKVVLWRGSSISKHLPNSQGNECKGGGGANVHWKVEIPV